jgi:hypothetical protein
MWTNTDCVHTVELVSTLHFLFPLAHRPSCNNNYILYIILDNHLDWRSHCTKLDWTQPQYPKLQSNHHDGQMDSSGQAVGWNVLESGLVRLNGHRRSECPWRMILRLSHRDRHWTGLMSFVKIEMPVSHCPQAGAEGLVELLRFVNLNLLKFCKRDASSAWLVVCFEQDSHRPSSLLSSPTPPPPPPPPPPGCAGPSGSAGGTG